MVAGFEIDLPANRRDTETIAIMSDSMHNTADEVLRLGIRKVAKAQGIERCDGSCPHGKNIPVDAAHTRGSPLEGLNSGGMVVGFYFEYDAKAISDVGKTGILFSCLHQEPLSVTREGLKPAD
jgi:hypothetical protein